MRMYKWLGVLGLISVWALAACGQTETPTVTPTVTFTAPPPTATNVPPTATPTPEPLAARVNGQAISLARYEQEVQRCEAGRTSAGLATETCRADALQGLIEQMAVEQAAFNSNLTMSEAEVEATLTQMVSEAGGAEAYQAWLTTNLYTDEQLRTDLRGELLRVKMSDQVTAQAGLTADQVHARMILVADTTSAEALLEQLKNGADFSSLAVAQSLDLSSRAAGGDLGWFPRGLLTVPEVEAAAFNLAPGETSGAITSTLGIHIVQTLERDPVHPLTPLAAQTVRAQVYQAWFDQLLAQAKIERLVTP